jgi:hypothetical protein
VIPCGVPLEQRQECRVYAVLGLAVIGPVRAAMSGIELFGCSGITDPDSGTCACGKHVYEPSEPYKWELRPKPKPEPWYTGACALATMYSVGRAAPSPLPKAKARAPGRDERRFCPHGPRRDL